MSNPEGALLHITPSTDKMGDIPGLAMLPVASCGPQAAHCGDGCNVQRLCKFRPTMARTWKKNSDAFANRSLRPQIREQLGAYFHWHRPRFFRVHIGGDFLDRDHVELWWDVAREAKDTKFLAFTKRRFRFENRPDNFALMLSQWPGLPILSRPGCRKSWVQTGEETRIPADALECAGQCSSCFFCWNLDELKRDVWFWKS